MKLVPTVVPLTAGVPPIRRYYRLRLSGPLLDRIDLQVYVRPVPLAELRAAEPGESSGDETRG